MTATNIHHSVDTTTSYQSVDLDSDHEPYQPEPIDEDEHEDEYDSLLNDKPTKTKWNTTHIFKIVIGAGIGSLLEFYSFGLVAYFEPELKQAFFPPSNTDYDALLQEFTLYGCAFAMRPFGGLLFGYIGDRFGRVYSLQLSLLLMIIPTMLYGILPNYSTIGIASTILIFLFRIIQGLCVGGEMSTALVYIIEESPSNMKATLTGYLWAFSFGSYFALIVYALYNSSTKIEPNNISEWTWRIAFISSILIGIFGIYIRKLMPNSYEFDNISQNNAILKNPISKIFESFYIEFFILFLGYIAPPILYYSTAVWLPAYMSSNLSNLEDIYSYDMQLISGALVIIFSAVSGHICDKYFGVYKFVKWFLSITIINVLICYSFISITTNIYVMSLFQILLSFNAFGGMACVFWCAVWIPDARIRNTLTGVTYNLGMALFVSTLFDVETYLANKSIKFGGLYAGIYVLIMCVMSFGAIWYAHNFHSWKNYHCYMSVNPHNVDENDIVDISDEEIEMENPYAVI
eukprot:184153_1